MANIDLTKYGITDTTEIVYNPSYEVLFAEETKEGLEGYEVGRTQSLTQLTLGLVYSQAVLLKISTLLWTKTQRTLYGGHQMSTRTITTQ